MPAIPPLTRAQVHNARMDTHAHAPAFISRRCAGYMRVEYAVTSTVPAQTFCPQHAVRPLSPKSMRHVHASRDGVTGGANAHAFRVQMHTHTPAESCAHAPAPSSVRASPWTVAWHLRWGAHRRGHTPENTRTGTHRMHCVRRYAPAAQLVRAVRDFDCCAADELDGAFRRVTCRETRSEEAAVKPRCFLTPSSTR